jgi:hypothetical protein
VSLEINRSGEQVVIHFRLDDVDDFGVVSVVGSFNDWTPGADVLVRGEDGSGTAVISTPVGRDVHFRYLSDGRRWFDDPDADAIDANGSVVYATVVEAEPEEPSIVEVTRSQH